MSYSSFHVFFVKSLLDQLFTVCLGSWFPALSFRLNFTVCSCFPPRHLENFLSLGLFVLSTAGSKIDSFGEVFISSGLSLSPCFIFLSYGHAEAEPTIFLGVRTWLKVVYSLAFAPSGELFGEIFALNDFFVDASRLCLRTLLSHFFRSRATQAGEPPWPFQGPPPLPRHSFAAHLVYYTALPPPPAIVFARTVISVFPLVFFKQVCVSTLESERSPKKDQILRVF